MEFTSDLDTEFWWNESKSFLERAQERIGREELEHRQFFGEIMPYGKGGNLEFWEKLRLSEVIAHPPLFFFLFF